MLWLYEHGHGFLSWRAAGRPVLTQLYAERRGDGLSNDCSFLRRSGCSFARARLYLAWAGPKTVAPRWAICARRLAPPTQPQPMRVDLSQALAGTPGDHAPDCAVTAQDA